MIEARHFPIGNSDFFFEAVTVIPRTSYGDFELSCRGAVRELFLFLSDLPDVLPVPVDLSDLGGDSWR